MRSCLQIIVQLRASLVIDMRLLEIPYHSFHTYSNKVTGRPGRDAQDRKGKGNHLHLMQRKTIRSKAVGDTRGSSSVDSSITPLNRFPSSTINGVFDIPKLFLPSEKVERDLH